MLDCETNSTSAHDEAPPWPDVQDIQYLERQQSEFDLNAGIAAGHRRHFGLNEEKYTFTTNDAEYMNHINHTGRAQQGDWTL